MSYPTLEQASERAVEVHATMTKPELWDVKVWKNHGLWHWSLKAGALTLYESYSAAYNDQPIRFSCLMGDHSGGTGSSTIWYDQTWYDNPNEAVEAQVKLARERLNILTRIVEHVEALV